MQHTTDNVFISYSKADGADFVENLRARLFKDEKGRQLKYWKRDRIWEHESEWNRSGSAISDSECMVLILTPDFIQSGIIPYLLKLATPGELWICLVKGAPDTDLDYHLLPAEVKDYPLYDIDKEWEAFVADLYAHCQVGKLLNMAPRSCRRNMCTALCCTTR